MSPTAKSIKITGITLTVGTDTHANGEAALFIYTKPQFGHEPEAGLIARDVYHEPRITDGELLVDLYVCEAGDMATDDRWTGSGEYYLCLLVAGPAGWPDDVNGGSRSEYWWATNGAVAKYNIQDALTTIEFSQFKEAGN